MKVGWLSWRRFPGFLRAGRFREMIFGLPISHAIFLLPDVWSFLRFIVEKGGDSLVGTRCSTRVRDEVVEKAPQGPPPF